MPKLDDLSALDAVVAKLLEPLPGDDPAGQETPHAFYLAINEARREDDPSAPRGPWERTLHRADWARVEELASHVLANRSKDLWIAAILCEAWIRTRGSAGAAPGLMLVEGLVARYWEHLYPRASDDDVSPRANIIAWLNQRLTTALFQTPIIPDKTNPHHVYSWADCKAAMRLETFRQRGASRWQTMRARLTLASIVAGLERIDAAVLAMTLEDLRRAQAMLEQTCATMDRLFGPEAPSLASLDSAVSEIGTFLSANGAGSSER